MLIPMLFAVVLAIGAPTANDPKPATTEAPERDTSDLSARLGPMQTARTFDRFTKVEVKQYTRPLGMALTEKDSPVVAVCLYARTVNGYSAGAWLELQVVDGNANAEPKVEWTGSELALLCDDLPVSATAAPWDAATEQYSDSVSITKAPGVPAIILTNDGTPTHRQRNSVRAAFELTGERGLGSAIGSSKKTEGRLVLHRPNEKLTREFRLTTQQIHAIREFCKATEGKKDQAPQPSPARRP